MSRPKRRKIPADQIAALVELRESCVIADAWAHITARAATTGAAPDRLQRFAEETAAATARARGEAKALHRAVSARPRTK